jgi:hypothetical protein
MWEELRRIGHDLPGDIRLVVLRGEGRAFSAGLDLAAVSAASGGGFSFAALAARDDAEDVIAGFQEGFSWLRRPDLVSLAAVRGHAIGAGFQLALACDLRVLADDARLSMAEVTLGLVPDLATGRLVDLVGYAARGPHRSADDAADAWIGWPHGRTWASTTPRGIWPPRWSPTTATRWWRSRRCWPGPPGGPRPTSSGPSGRRRAVDSVTSPGAGNNRKDRSGRSVLPPRLSQSSGELT